MTFALYWLHMAHIQVRIDEKTKKAAVKVLDEMGLDLSRGISLYLEEVIRTESIPFTIQTKKAWKKSQMKKRRS